MPLTHARAPECVGVCVYVCVCFLPSLSGRECCSCRAGGYSASEDTPTSGSASFSSSKSSFSEMLLQNCVFVVFARSVRPRSRPMLSASNGCAHQGGPQSGESVMAGERACMLARQAIARAPNDVWEDVRQQDAEPSTILIATGTSKTKLASRHGTKKPVAWLIDRHALQVYRVDSSEPYPGV